VTICPVTSQSAAVTVCEDVQSESPGDQSQINQAFIDMTLVGFFKATKFEVNANTEYGGAHPNGPFKVCSARFTSAPSGSAHAPV